MFRSIIFSQETIVSAVRVVIPLYAAMANRKNVPVSFFLSFCPGLVICVRKVGPFFF